MTSVLFSVRFNNFAQTIGVTRSYQAYVLLPVYYLYHITLVLYFASWGVITLNGTYSKCIPLHFW